MRMRHGEGNTLKDQAYCERIGTSPLNAMECEPRYSPVRGVGRAPSQHPVSGRRGFARSTGVVPDVPQLCTAPCEPAPAIAASRGDQWHGLSEGVAAVYTGDGGRIDGPCVDAARSAAVSGATVATAAGGLRDGAAV